MEKKQREDDKMDRRTFLKILPTITMLVGTASNPAQQASGDIDLQPITLPKPEKDNGKSLMTALQERRTIRNISPKELPLQVLSNLLWSAFGINRESGAFGKSGRTAPSASNSQEIDLYIAMSEGVYLYEAIPHRLAPIVAGDFRARACRQAGAAIAPVNIFYVVDLTRYDLGPEQPDRSIGDPEVQKSYYYTDTGFIAQNVYLFAASQGLAAWFHNCDKENTAKDFKLHHQQRVLFAQSIGYPAES
jgi:nitroreductase